MYSKHRFYCQHPNGHGVYDELIKVGLKDESTLVITYMDITAKKLTKFQTKLTKSQTKELAIVLKEAYKGDDDYKSHNVITLNDVDITIENTGCTSDEHKTHHNFQLEDNNRYECVHLIKSDVKILYNLLAITAEKMQ